MDDFAAQLKTDPTVALRPFPIRPELLVRGPLHRLNYVVEIVGQRTLAAAQSKWLLDPGWQAPLGKPKVFVMAPSDAVWRELLTTDAAQSYDSVALVWPYLTPQGSISMAAAQKLLAAAEHFASQVGRRAMSLPSPDAVDATVAQLRQVQENLDVGVSLALAPKTSLSERAVWIEARRLGLELSGQGLFHWMVPGWAEHILELAPLEEAAIFSLGGVQGGVSHDVLSLGFSLPRSPEPLLALDGCIRIARHFESELGCLALHEDSDLDSGEEANLRHSAKLAIEALTRAGLPPGSIEARQLYGNT